MILEKYTQTAKKWLASAAARRPTAVLCLIVISLVASIAAALAPSSWTEGKNSLKESRDCVVASMKDKPKTAAGHYMLALLNMQIEDYPQAKNELKQAMQMDPDGRFAGGIEAAKELDRSLDKKIVSAEYGQRFLYAAFAGVLVIFGVVARRKSM